MEYQKRYSDYNSFIKELFGERIQKISLNAGFTCPNRDGSKGIGGCTYCNNKSFNKNKHSGVATITQQLDSGISFFKHKQNSQRYFAYFQSYTNTYADVCLVKELYLEALRHPNVVGLVIGTRPDCVNEELLDFLTELAKTNFVSLEFGIESTLNRSLKAINRCHTFEETVNAYAQAQGRGIHLGGHIILGLPGESRSEMLNHAVELSKLPLQSLKIHHLQIVKHTKMAYDYTRESSAFQLFKFEEYIDFVIDFITYLEPSIHIERFISEAPLQLLIAPQWGGVKNFEVVEKIKKKLIKKDVWQGKNLVTC